VYRSLTRGPAELPPGVDPSATEPVDVQLPKFADGAPAKTPDTNVLSPASEVSKYKPLPLTRPDAARTTAPPFNASSKSPGLGNATPAD
uniref:hypothetical protein n=1 Tax=Salmonella sp. SAL4458 TaxID=3159913 RepID=UPI00397D0F35